MLWMSSAVDVLCCECPLLWMSFAVDVLGCWTFLSCTTSEDTLTFAATVERHERHYGDARQLERRFAMPADSTTRPETRCDQQI